MTAVAVDDMLVETVECRRGTVLLTTTPAGWEIVATHKTLRFRGAPAVYRVTLKLCDCRTNPTAVNLWGSHTGGKPSPRSNWGTRLLCTKPPEHNKDCHKKLDHCPARAHRGFDIRSTFDAVCKLYNETDRRVVPSIWSRI